MTTWTGHYKWNSSLAFAMCFAAAGCDSESSSRLDAAVSDGGGAADAAVVLDASKDAVAATDTSLQDANVDGASVEDWHLWVLEGTSTHLYGYAPSQLTATNGDPAAIDITLTNFVTVANNSQMTFDRQGDLWISEISAYRFPGSELMATGAARAVAALSNPAGNYGKIAFDAAGNLWRSTYGQATPLSRYDAADLAVLLPTPSALTAKFSSSAATDYPLAFDELGNLYTGFSGREGATEGPGYFGRYNASQLGGTGVNPDAPALSIKPPFNAVDMVRSKSGQFLLVNGSATILRYSSAQMLQNGLVQAITPEATITVDAPGNANIKWIALDREGNLFAAENKNRVLKISRTDLSQTGVFTVTPVITLRARASDPNARFSAIVVH